VVLGLYAGVLVSGALPYWDGSLPRGSIAGIVFLGVTFGVSRVTTPVAKALDRRVHTLLGWGTVGVFVAAFWIDEATVTRHLPYWLALVGAGLALWVIGRRWYAEYLLERNEIRDRIEGRTNPWLQTFWAFVGILIGDLVVDVDVLFRSPTEYLHWHVLPLLVGAVVGFGLVAALADRPNDVILVVTDDALILDQPGWWGPSAIGWRWVRGIRAKEDTLRVRLCLWTGSYSCPLSAVDRPQETVRALRDRAETG
jgi:hypothetical protein